MTTSFEPAEPHALVSETKIVEMYSFLFKCHICGSNLAHNDTALRCDGGHLFRYHGNVIDFSGNSIDPVQEMARNSFEVEWNKYYPNLGWAPADISTETEMFLSYTRSMPSFFAGKVVVDAGCGNGRYINILNTISVPPPKVIIGIELSDNAYLAAKNCSNYDNVVILKMDLNLLPQVLKEPVDYLYSIGVLHHTPDARKSFFNLAKCVTTGGFFSAFLYGKGNPILYRVNSFLRNRLFRRWPHRLVYCLCVLVAIPCQLFRIKFIGPWTCDFVTRFVFVSSDVHNMFDAYTAGFTSFHERREVEQWYKEAGFDYVVEEHLNRTSLFCIGRAL
jgi:SAM-dependent methyltransferase